MYEGVGGRGCKCRGYRVEENKYREPSAEKPIEFLRRKPDSWNNIYIVARGDHASVGENAPTASIDLKNLDRPWAKQTRKKLDVYGVM